MYLHKDGYEYHNAIFESLRSLTKEKIVRTNNVPTSRILAEESTDPLPALTKLAKHCADIVKEIERESNSLQKIKNEFQKAAISGNGASMDKNFIEITELINLIKRTDSLFITIESKIKLYLEELMKWKASITSNQNDMLLGMYDDIIGNLTYVKRNSNDLAAQITKILRDLKINEDLIKKEEDSITDFDRNIRSWF
ncbi:MAG: hypothetical protein WC758_02995 [Candidatus Woesearchaeota archaeon]|jgi:hypothetical protein